jgi:hypothetical protein
MRRLPFFLFIFLGLFITAPILMGEQKKPDIGLYVETSDGYLYGISRSFGFLLSSDGGKTWERRNNGLPKQIVYPFDGSDIIPLTSVSADPVHEKRIVVTDSWGAYISEDRGETWEKITLSGPISTSAYVTSAALSPHDKNTLLVGTSFSGLFITRDRGKTWKQLKKVSGPLYRGAGFREEISGIVFDPQETDTVYLGTGFGNGLYRVGLSEQSISRIPFPGDKKRIYIRQLAMRRIKSGGRFALAVYSPSGYWLYHPGEDNWEKEGRRKDFTRELSERVIVRQRKAAEQYGIYLKSWNASGKDLEKHLNFLADNGLNAIVVDVKDDLGRVTYNTELELPKKIGSVREHIDIRELLKAAHEKGIYVIGRIVCFQDPYLYRYDNNRYAVWNSETRKAWAHKIKRIDEETEEETWIQREFWVDSFSEFAWEYNISIAEELQNLGIDEIQFDYIRFPSDGDFSGVHYRYRKEGMRKIDALESFLRKMRERITIPVSTDLYGFNSWYRMGNWIGQCIEMVSHYVDVICPMFYPSHFPRDFLKDMNYLDRAKYIYREGSDRSAAIVEGRSIIRPYVQAFLIGGELDFDEPVYSRYLELQIEGTQESLSSGFTLWNNSNRYYMVVRPLKKLISKKTEDAPFLD